MTVAAVTGLLRAEDYAITTFAGTALVAGTADGTPGTFNNPFGIAIDAAKNIYVADTTNHIIRKISPSRVVSTLAGAPPTGPRSIEEKSRDGTGSAARFDFPVSLAVDSAGNVYVADLNNSTIRKITPGGVVSTLAGAPAQFGTTDGPGSAARFFFPGGVAVDASGNIYVADTGNHLIRRVTPEGVVSTVAGAPQPGSADGTGSAARFSSPWGIAVENSGNLVVADSGNNTIRRVTPNGVVSTVAGVVGAAGSQDGVGTSARFNMPRGLSVDAGGNIIVADYGNALIRSITPAGVVSSLAGAAGIIGAVDSVGAAARFFDPTDVVTDGNTIYVADTSNNLIRRGAPASLAPLPVLTIQPVDQEVAVGQSVTFRVVASGSALTYQWLRNSVPIPGATNSTYTISSPQLADSAAYRVRVSGAGGSRDSEAGNLTVTSVGTGPIAITARPLGQHVLVGQSVTFSVTAAGNLAYQWFKDGVAIAGATASSYSIPSAQISHAGNYAVRVASGDASETAMAQLVVTSASGASISIAAHPAGQTVDPGAGVTLTVTATATAPLSYQWFKNDVAISGATSSSFSIGSVQALDAGIYMVRVSAAGENVFSAPAIVTVTGPGPGPDPGPTTFSRLVNLSILTDVATAGDSFTMGYVVGGAGTSGTKPVLIRAAGPTLGAAPFNIGGALSDPRLELFAGPTPTGGNDNWGGSATLSNAFAAVGAFAYVNATSLDAAALANISAGDNSVVVSAAGNGTGTVIAELYDSTPVANMTGTSPRLVNVSVLKHLGTSLTAGFVIDGNTSKRVLIRAVGPTIGAAPFNVPGAVADPQLTLFSGQSPVASNNDWGGTAELTAAFTQVGAFALPAASRDAALLATLAPGNYTVQVSGVGNTTGVAIVEVYEVP